MEDVHLVEAVPTFDDAGLGHFETRCGLVVNAEPIIITSDEDAVTCEACSA